MKKEEIIAGVNNLLTEGFEIEAELLKPEAQLNEDLELDSLDAVDLIVAMEKEFGFTIEEEEARAMRTLEDVYTYIFTKANEPKTEAKPSEPKAAEASGP